MKTATYPQLGTRVNFVRQGVGDGMVEGSGIIHAIVLDPNKRLMVQMETDEVNEQGQKVRRNVHVTCLNPSDDFKAAFKSSLETVEALGNEGNGKVKETVAEYNKLVETAQEPVLGAVVSFED